MTGQIHNLSPALMQRLTELEARIGFSLTITSGYRDPGHNADVGGVEGSEHTDDPSNGADVLCKRSVTRFKMVRHLMEMGVSRIGIGKDFIHVGVSTAKPQQVCWTYYS